MDSYRGHKNAQSILCFSILCNFLSCTTTSLSVHQEKKRQKYDLGTTVHTEAFRAPELREYSPVQYKPADFKELVPKVGRGIASMNSGGSTSPHTPGTEPEIVKNEAPTAHTQASLNLSQMGQKRLYFMALLNQYYQLRTNVDEAMPAINSCSHFHTSLLQGGLQDSEVVQNYWPLNIPKGRDSLQNPAFALSGKTIDPDSRISSKFPNGLFPQIPLTKDDARAGLFPELSLSVSNGGPVPQVRDIWEAILGNKQTSEVATLPFINENMQSQIKIQKALYAAYQIHVEKIYKELQELCEFGTSAAYYSYENLMNYMLGEAPKMYTPENMKALSKAPVIFNILLRESIELHHSNLVRTASVTEKNRKPASEKFVWGRAYSPYEREILTRIQSEWPTQYLGAFRKARLGIVNDPQTVKTKKDQVTGI